MGAGIKINSVRAKRARTFLMSLQGTRYRVGGTDIAFDRESDCRDGSAVMCAGDKYTDQLQFKSMQVSTNDHGG